MTNVHPSKLFLGDPELGTSSSRTSSGLATSLNIASAMRSLQAEFALWRNRSRLSLSDLQSSSSNSDFDLALARSDGLSMSETNNFTVDNQLHSKFDTGPLQHTVLARSRLPKFRA